MAKQNKPQPKAEKKKPVEQKAVLTTLIPEPLAKKIFIGLALGLLILMASVSHQFGITADENFHRMYGHDVVDFYKSGGKIGYAATNIGQDSLMVYYGGLFDGTTALVSDTLPSVNEWNIRHFINSIFGWFAMLCAALVAVQLGGWQAGLITLVLMAFSPRFFGESMNNPKDITMAAGYMVCYVFIIMFLKQLPKPSLKVALGLGASIGMAMGIRIGGLLLIPYLFLFYGLAMLGLFGLGELFNFSKFKENIWPSFKYVLLASVMGYCISLLFWPYGLVSPIKHPLEALQVAEKYPVTIRILFEGSHIFSTQVPWYYIPKWLWISTPLFGLLGLIASFALVPYLRRKRQLLFLGFLYFTILFPLCYIIYKKSVLYDTMRHFFFVYPSIIILAGLTFSYFISRFQKGVKYAIVIMLLVLIALPARYMFANHPNEYVYFNELEGGIKGAFANYELDYYMSSVKQCMDWIKKNENMKRSDGRKTLIISNAVSPATHYMKTDTANVQVGYVSYRNRCAIDADYLVLYNRYVDRELLLNGCFPPEQAIYTVYADGVPLSCVIRKDDRGDVLGLQAVQKNDFETAVQYLEPYCKKYPKADVALMNLGLAYLNTVRTDPTRAQKGIDALNACLALNKDNIQALYYLSAAYEMVGNKTQADYLKNIVQQMQQGQ